MAKQNFLIHESWNHFFEAEKNQPYFHALMQQVLHAYETKTCFPKLTQLFRAFYVTKLSSIKIVILGQDPYHGPDQANGLAFSVNKQVKLPPSLKNIFKELKENLAITNTCGDLTAWAQQGVLLLNTALSVEAGKPNSHVEFNWSEFTDHVLSFLNDQPQALAFVLWGNNAKAKKKFITNPRHIIFESAHPSPLSAHNGFFKSNIFLKLNHWLEIHNYEPINWKLS